MPAEQWFEKKSLLTHLNQEMKMLFELYVTYITQKYICKNLRVAIFPISYMPWPKTYFKPLSANPTKWSNSTIQNTAQSPLPNI